MTIIGLKCVVVDYAGWADESVSPETAAADFFSVFCFVILKISVIAGQVTKGVEFVVVTLINGITTQTRLSFAIGYVGPSYSSGDSQ